MTTQVTDVDFIQRQLDYAVKARADAIRTITLAGQGFDYQWNLTALVRRETEVLLYQRALEKGVEAAAKAAVSRLLDPLGSSTSNPFDNAIALEKASAAMGVLRVLSAVGLTHETLGKLLVRDG